MTEPTLRQLLEYGLKPAWIRLHAKLLDDIEAGFLEWSESLRWNQQRFESRKRSTDAYDLRAQQLVDFLMRRVQADVQYTSDLDAKFTEFRRRQAHAGTTQGRRENILDFAMELGATRRQLSGDRAAFARWFGDDAIAERYRTRKAETERRIVFELQRLGVLCAHVLKIAAGADEEAGKLWQRFELEKLLQPLLGYLGNTQIRIESFRCLATVLQVLPKVLREHAITDSTLKFIYRSSLERRQDIWIQCEALNLLEGLSPTSLEQALRNRIQHPAEDDDLFVRRRAVRLIGAQLGDNPQLAELLKTAARDPSPAVRQAVCEVLVSAPGDIVLLLVPQLMRKDAEPAVRAAALLTLLRLLSRDDLLPPLVRSLVQVFEHEQDPFVLRVALQVLSQGDAILLARPPAAELWREQLMPVLARLHKDAEHLQVRRWAAAIREQLWVRVNPEATQLKSRLEEALQNLPEGQTRKLPRDISSSQDQDILGRTLALLAQQDFGFDLEHRWGRSRIRRGDRFGFRLWRFIHELRNPSTDKRQAHRHTIGRIFRGTIRAPSGTIAELARTKVPGEPLFMGSEGGWRPYLPLVDEVISALDQPFGAGALLTYSSEGVTELHPPRSFWRRLRARYLLTVNFSSYADLRNWNEGSGNKPDAYVKALEELGFQARFRVHQDEEHDRDELWTADPAVVRFFPALALPGFEMVAQIQDYFYSIYENSLAELCLFLGMLLSWFIGKHIYTSFRIRKIRSQIPLVIGGWGTRGKSGTERIKAALFNALGHGVVSKTTGCEAMFLHGHPYGKLREMFLFRPYDKATIWEQVDVLDITTKLNAHIFLWECMGLTPSYVAVLQQQWVKDDLATITNTYPDHEDLQGPAGIDIPAVMTNFIPHDSVLITTEEQMTPILKDSAQLRNTSFHSVGWLQAGLLCSDVLERFPYAEHPYNIALVLKLAEELGIDTDFALKEMADRVVADLGVLKASPPSTLRGRVLEFINGMSANERYGCLGNWDRMGFTDQDVYQEPGIRLSTVVNNRADRVARSRVFASIIVRDISVDTHFLIGTNLDGLQNYIREEWDDYSKDLSLWQDNNDSTPAELFEETARRMRIPCYTDHLKARLEAMLQGSGAGELQLDDLEAVWADPEVLQQQLAAQGMDYAWSGELVEHVRQMVTGYREYCEFMERLAVAGSQPDAQLDAAYRELYWRWFERKMIVIEDSHATGDQVIATIADNTPPGLHNRVMGVQNIKGTGLDFVYRWQAWEACHTACVDLCDKDPGVAEGGLRVLSAFQEYGLLCEEHVGSVIETVKHSQNAQNELFQAELALIKTNLDNAMEQLHGRLKKGSGSSGGWLRAVLPHIEAFLDAGDAVKRRKQANRIYRDLAAERISHERAALELGRLTKRQKGGWLLARVEEMLRRLRERIT